MILDWYRHLTDPKEREELASTIKNSTIAINRLREIVEEREKALLAEEITPSAFDNPSWAYKEARNIGRRQELQYMKLLLTM